MKKDDRIGLSALACVLASGVVVGCNGDSNGGPIPLPTTAPTAAPTATTPAAQAFAAPITLSSGQSGTLSLTVRGTQVSGSLRVNARTATAAARSSALFSFTIPAGVYSVSGTFALPRSFSLAGTFPAPIGRFSISGTIPTQTQAGAFSVSASGQTATGAIPALNTRPTPVPTRTGATPTPTTPTSGTPTPTSPGTSGNTNLVFSGVSGSNITTTPIASIDSVPAAILLSGSFGSSLTARLENGAGTNPLRRSLGIQALRSNAAIQSGTSLPAVGVTTVQNGVLIQLTESRASGFAGTWRSSGGTVSFASVTSNRATLRLQGVTMVPLDGGQGQATGSFTLSGNVTFSFQRIQGT